MGLMVEHVLMEEEKFGQKGSKLLNVKTSPGKKLFEAASEAEKAEARALAAKLRKKSGIKKPC